MTKVQDQFSEIIFFSILVPHTQIFDAGNHFSTTLGLIRHCPCHHLLDHAWDRMIGDYVSYVLDRSLIHRMVTALVGTPFLLVQARSFLGNAR